MRSLRTVALLIVIPVAGMAQLPQRDTRPITPVGDSTISGRVMTSEGRPLARARVMLRFTGGDSAPRITVVNGVPTGSNFWQHVTDATGQFTFPNLPAGSYTLTASHGQYLAMQYGQKYVGQPGRPIALAAGQRLRADLVAVRGGAITGRIFDENGEPIDGVSVQAYRYSIEGKRKVIVPVGGRSYASNDIGQYRIAGLSPGDYLVAAIYRGNMEVVPDAVAKQGYAPTWYPGAMQPAGAQKVRVAPGNDALNIDFTLMPTRMVQATGVVTSSSAVSGGASPGNIQMWVTPVDNELAMVTRPTARVMQGGNFVVMDLTPGEYIFTAQMSDVTGMRQQAEMIGRAGRANIDPRTLPPIRETEYGSLRVSVAGQPLENLSIQLRPGARVSVKFQSDQPLPPNRQFVLYSDDQRNTARPIQVGRELDPVISAGPGLYFPMMQLPDGWVMEKAMARGRDVRISGLEITDNSPIELTIHVSSRGAMLSGTVAASVSGAPADYTLVALANDPADRTSRTGGVKTARPDQTGRFMLKGLGAGTYFVAAVDYADQNELYDPAFWARIEPHAIMVTVGAGEMKAITVPFISRR